MDHSDHFLSQEGTDSPFGQVFSAYSNAFFERRISFRQWKTGASRH
ncbi:MAG: hypothetical protein P8L39_02550 [Halioglobus sp.]|nr:hypothetical protein [Halioglobus sp.]